EEEAAEKWTVLGECQVERRGTRRERLARHEADDAVLGVEPDRRDVAVARPRADHRDRPVVHAHDVAHVVAHAERTPLAYQVSGAPPERHEQIRAVARTQEGGRLVDLTGGLADEGSVTDDEPDLSLALDGLLDPLTPGQLEHHALRARRLGVAPGGIVEREVLDDHEVGDADVREAGDERLDGGLRSSTGRRGGRARARSPSSTRRRTRRCRASATPRTASSTRPTRGYRPSGSRRSTARSAARRRSKSRCWSATFPSSQPPRA